MILSSVEELAGGKDEKAGVDLHALETVWIHGIFYNINYIFI